MDETLLNAAEKGHLKTVQALLKKGHKIDSTDSQGTTPLMLACLYGHKNLVEELLRRGADVSLRDEYSSILITACDTDANNVAEMVEMILKAGPRQMLAYKNSDGLTALDVAKQHNNRQLVQLLVRAEKNMPERNADGSKN